MDTQKDYNKHVSDGEKIAWNCLQKFIKTNKIDAYKGISPKFVQEFFSMGYRYGFNDGIQFINTELSNELKDNNE